MIRCRNCSFRPEINDSLITFPYTQKSSRDFSLPPCFLIILSINFVQIPVSACIELYNIFIQSVSSPYIFSALPSDTHTAAVSLLLQNALPETVPDCFHNLTLPPQTVRSSDRIRSRPPHYNNGNFLRLLRFHIPFPQKYPVPESP